MICPHCGKAIKRSITEKAIRRAKSLRAEGYSFRDIEKILNSEGMNVSYASLSRKMK